ncbi:sigma-70 family RNA polymerase sigma factor [Streptomyces sp. MZ04]|uniref:sigma-70 family RNA polymerase sigma factor n=1 Tax=Streptomyces sp. MZ04 TaxID=2559236 RepID=UPI00107E8EC9|nr:sigma-70 family RNA polymerase sigma factor [Streptomyces sp. MZ04]TGB13824.1 sigma-70 family RNA polymerase sigma factor [Streptomyces sp. MZ04]
METPPEPFTSLAKLTEGAESIEQAKALTEALNAVPDLQRWLREERQRIVRTLHERDGVSYTEMAPQLGVKPERVSGIARGHSRSPRRGTEGGGAPATTP